VLKNGFDVVVHEVGLSGGSGEPNSGSVEEDAFVELTNGSHLFKRTEIGEEATRASGFDLESGDSGEVAEQPTDFAGVRFESDLT